MSVAVSSRSHCLFQSVALAVAIFIAIGEALPTGYKGKNDLAVHSFGRLYFRNNGNTHPLLALMDGGHRPSGFSFNRNVDTDFGLLPPPVQNGPQNSYSFSLPTGIFSSGINRTNYYGYATNPTQATTTKPQPWVITSLGTPVASFATTTVSNTLNATSSSSSNHTATSTVQHNNITAVANISSTTTTSVMMNSAHQWVGNNLTTLFSSNYTTASNFSLTSTMASITLSGQHNESFTVKNSTFHAAQSNYTSGINAGHENVATNASTSVGGNHLSATSQSNSTATIVSTNSTSTNSTVFVTTTLSPFMTTLPTVTAHYNLTAANMTTLFSNNGMTTLSPTLSNFTRDVSNNLTSLTTPSYNVNSAYHQPSQNVSNSTMTTTMANSIINNSTTLSSPSNFTSASTRFWETATAYFIRNETNLDNKTLASSKTGNFSDNSVTANSTGHGNDSGNHGFYIGNPNAWASGNGTANGTTNIAIGNLTTALPTGVNASLIATAVPFHNATMNSTATKSMVNETSSINATKGGNVTSNVVTLTTVHSNVTSITLTTIKPMTTENGTKNASIIDSHDLNSNLTHQINYNEKLHANGTVSNATTIVTAMTNNLTANNLTMMNLTKLHGENGSSVTLKPSTLPSTSGNETIVLTTPLNTTSNSSSPSTAKVTTVLTITGGGNNDTALQLRNNTTTLINQTVYYNNHTNSSLVNTTVAMMTNATTVSTYYTTTMTHHGSINNETAPMTVRTTLHFSTTPSTVTIISTGTTGATSTVSSSLVWSSAPSNLTASTPSSNLTELATTHGRNESSVPPVYQKPFDRYSLYHYIYFTTVLTTAPTPTVPPPPSPLQTPSVMNEVLTIDIY